MDTILLISVVVLLVTFSAVCSGLNVALMSLQPGDLRRKAKLGNVQAISVLPLRLNSHLSIASIVITNVGLISANSLVLDSRLNGIVAGSLSTLLIVVFGEVLPQAWFARYALAFCASFAPLLKLMIIFSYPISKPLQVFMDWLVGHETQLLHSRGELGMIISEHLTPGASELDEDEVEIMRGALGLSAKKVRDIMTPMRQVYWVEPDTLIDGAKIDEIKTLSWSRIPVLNPEKTQCSGILLMKDLVDIDFDNSPLRVNQLPLHDFKIAGSMMALDTLFRKFIGAKSHMMPIERDDKIIGIVTIEDLIEEILGHEIEDESDHARIN